MHLMLLCYIYRDIYVDMHKNYSLTFPLNCKAEPNQSLQVWSDLYTKKHIINQG